LVWPGVKRAAHLLSGQDPGGCFFCDHKCGGVCIAAGDLRHHACIYHPQPVAPLFCYCSTMLDIDKTPPKDPDELRQFTALLLAEVLLQEGKAR